jgi:preprotein translocase subunit SecA
MSAFQIDDLPIESQMLGNSLEEAQKKVENYFFDIRKNLFEYDQVLNKQRERIYAERKLSLLAPELTEKIEKYVEESMDDILDAKIGQCKDRPVDEWPLDQLAEALHQYCYFLKDLDTVTLKKKCTGSKPLETLRFYLRFRGLEAYSTKRDAINQIEPDLMLQAERYFLRMHIDDLWKEHLSAIKFLQQAVGLRGYAQRDPLTEYKLDGFQIVHSADKNKD